MVCGIFRITTWKKLSKWEMFYKSFLGTEDGGLPLFSVWGNTYSLEGKIVTPLHIKMIVCQQLRVIFLYEKNLITVQYSRNSFWLDYWSNWGKMWSKRLVIWKLWEDISCELLWLKNRVYSVWRSKDLENIDHSKVSNPSYQVLIIFLWKVFFDIELIDENLTKCPYLQCFFSSMVHVLSGDQFCHHRSKADSKSSEV